MVVIVLCAIFSLCMFYCGKRSGYWLGRRHERVFGRYKYVNLHDSSFFKYLHNEDFRLYFLQGGELVDVITLQHVVEGQRMVEVRFIDSRDVKYVPIENLYMQYLVYPRRSLLFSTPSGESLPRKHISGQRPTL